MSEPQKPFGTHDQVLTDLWGRIDGLECEIRGLKTLLNELARELAKEKK
jgi:hypothetical protein